MNASGKASDPSGSSSASDDEAGSDADDDHGTDRARLLSSEDVIGRDVVDAWNVTVEREATVVSAAERARNEAVACFVPSTARVDIAWLESSMTFSRAVTALVVF